MSPAQLDQLLERFADIDPRAQSVVMMNAFYSAMEERTMCGPEIAEAFEWFRAGWRAASRVSRRGRFARVVDAWWTRHGPAFAKR